MTKKRRRRQAEIARRAYHALAKIPDRFLDDGCSYSPDSIFHYEIGWACKIHDWKYCSRTGGPRDMTKQQRKAADKELRDNIGLSFPKWLGWVRYIYYRAVRRFGSVTAWDSCGPDAGYRCKHNMLLPLWMKQLNTLEDPDETRNERSSEAVGDGAVTRRAG